MKNQKAHELTLLKLFEQIPLNSRPAGKGKTTGTRNPTKEYTSLNESKRPETPGSKSTAVFLISEKEDTNRNSNNVSFMAPNVWNDNSKPKLDLPFIKNEIIDDKLVY